MKPMTEADVDAMAESMKAAIREGKQFHHTWHAATADATEPGDNFQTLRPRGDKHLLVSLVGKGSPIDIHERLDGALAKAIRATE